MEEKTIKSKVISGMGWKFGERISAQAVSFVVSIVLARLLCPEDYGAIAIVNIFITLANVFVDSGFGNSLIQKKNADNLDFSSVLYFNIVMSIGLYVLLYISAPFIAGFYNIEVLSSVIRVLGLRLIVAGINNVQHAYVSKQMIFKRFFWSTLFGTVLSAVIGIAMAYKGYGVWALVGQYMTNTTVDTLVLWFTVKWRPILKFSISRLKSLFTYGWKLLVSALLDTGYNEIRSLLIGKIYTPADLALYDKGKSFPNLVVVNINSSVQSVLFPAMSDCQDEKEHLKALTKRSISISSYIMFPIMAGLALVAEPFVKLLLTEKWLPCVPYLQIYCFVMALMPVHTANLQAIKALGRSDVFLKLEIIKKVLGFAVLIGVINFGVLAVAISGIFMTILSSIINAYPNEKLLDYGFAEQIKDMLNSAIPLVFMTIAVMGINVFGLSVLFDLITKVIVGAIAYVASSYVLKNKSFIYIMNIVCSKIIKN